MENILKVINILCMVFVVASVYGLITSFVALPFLGLVALICAIYFGWTMWKERFDFGRLLGWVVAAIIFSMF